MTTLSLKWGTLKRWDFKGSEKGAELLREYFDIGTTGGAMQQNDTDRQKEIICELIDICDDPNGIYLDWDDKYISKKKAKDYVTGYERK